MEGQSNRFKKWTQARLLSVTCYWKADNIYLLMRLQGDRLLAYLRT